MQPSLWRLRSDPSQQAAHPGICHLLGHCGAKETSQSRRGYLAVRMGAVWSFASGARSGDGAGSRLDNWDLSHGHASSLLPAAGDDR